MTDTPLNLRGIRQAKAVAKALRPESVDLIYTSALQRARHTAELIRGELGIKSVVVDPRLNELDFGKWEGAHYRQLARKATPAFRRWREGKLKKPPGGESVTSLARRVSHFFKEIMHLHQKEKVAIVSHGGPIKMFLFKVLQASSSIWSFRIDPGSISLIEGNPQLFQIVWSNRTDHLPLK